MRPTHRQLAGSVTSICFGTDRWGIAVRQSETANRRRVLRIIGLLLVLIGTTSAQADQVEWTFDDPKPSWRVTRDERAVTVSQQVRTQFLQRRGDAAEHLRLDVTERRTEVHIDHDLPAARVIEDLVLSVWVRCNQPEVRLSLRLVFPDETDPATGRVLTTYVTGPAAKYTRRGDWQQLTGTTLEKQVRDQVFLLRGRLKKPSLTARDVYVDQVRLTLNAVPGPVDLVIDDLDFGPIVAPRSGTHVVPVPDESTVKTPVEFRSHRLIVEGHPFLPRLIPHHGEPAETLEAAGVNVVWVPDYRRDVVLNELREHGLWAMATPPRAARSPEGQQAASLFPFSEATAPILFWYPGTNIPAKAREELIDWNRQIRAADRSLKRPIMADVDGEEKVYSRHIDLLGISRRVLHRDRSFLEYRHEITRRRQHALPWSLIWTWVYCEPDPVEQNQRSVAGQLPLSVEPEQIRLQVYAALSAGCRGIGFWKESSLEAVSSREMMLAISQLSLEMQLLEPFVATGHVDGFISQKGAAAGPRPRGQANAGANRLNVAGTPQITRGQLDFRSSGADRSRRDLLIRAQLHQQQEQKRTPAKLEAAVIRHDHGVLLLPVWYDSASQFVPAPMQAHNVSFVVPGVPASASAWEITPTRIRSLNRKPVAGGVQVTLETFDQTAAVLVTSNRDLIGELQQLVNRSAGTSAYLEVELASAKLGRVRQVEEELFGLGVGQSLSRSQLAYASGLLQSARTSLSRREFHRARDLARASRAVLRKVQRASWNDAVARLSHPGSSAHTRCYGTLPDYWTLVRSLGGDGSSSERNLLTSGSFEDPSTITTAWSPIKTDLGEDVRVRADLVPSTLQNPSRTASADGNQYALRLEAVPRPQTEMPTLIPDPPVRVNSPPITVRTGQIVHVSGWVRKVVSPRNGFDGVTVEDSLTGERGRISLRSGNRWTRFSFVREVRETGPMHITLSLHGLGIVEFDDLELRVHEGALFTPEQTPPRPEPDPVASGVRSTR